MMEQIWMRAKQKDQEATLAILQRTEKSIYAAIHKYVWVHKDVEDLYQDGVELVLKCIETYQPEKGVPFLAYVHSKLKYYFMDENKKRFILSLDAVTEDGLTLGDQIAADVDLEKSLLEQELSDALQSALSELTTREYKCVYGFYFLHLSITEIAESQGIAYRTAYNAKQRGLKKLAQALVNFRSDDDKVV